MRSFLFSLVFLVVAGCQYSDQKKMDEVNEYLSQSKHQVLVVQFYSHANAEYVVVQRGVDDTTRRKFYINTWKGSIPAAGETWEVRVSFGGTLSELVFVKRIFK